jgi:hypothetical protein
VEEHFRLDLDIGPVQSAIEQLEFVQLKGKFGIQNGIFKNENQEKDKIKWVGDEMGIL